MIITGGGGDADFDMESALDRVERACGGDASTLKRKTAECERTIKDCQAVHVEYQKGDPILGKVDLVHGNGIYVNDINTPWGPQQKHYFASPYPYPAHRGANSGIGFSGGCTAPNVGAIKAEYGKDWGDHFSVANDWGQWYAWATAITEKCRQDFDADKLKAEQAAQREKEEKEREAHEQAAKEREAKERAAKDKEIREREEREQAAKTKDQANKAEQRKNDEVASRKSHGKHDTHVASGGGTSTAGTCDQECQRQRRIAEGFKQQDEARVQQQQMAQSEAAVAGAVFMAQGGNRPTELSTHLFKLEFGFGLRLWPVMTDSTGPQITSFSKQDSSGGTGFDVGLEYWPIYRRHLGVGVYGAAAADGMVMPGGALYGLQYGGGVRAYVGNRAGWSLAGEVGILESRLGNSSILFDSKTSGSGGYSTFRVGLGPTWCAIEDHQAAGHCTLALSGELLWDFTGIARPAADATAPAETGAARLYRFALVARTDFLGEIGFTFELGRDYPAAGTASYPLDSSDRDHAGTAFALVLQKSFNWFSGSSSAGIPRRHDSGDRELDPDLAIVDQADIEWASQVRSVSSQYGDTSWSAQHALGPPDVYPQARDAENAWASRDADSGGEYIEVGFAHPAKIRQVHVYETYNPGAISEVELVDASGTRIPLTERAVQRSAQGAAISVFDVECTAQPVVAARVKLDSAGVAGWNELDAVGIVPCSAPPATTTKPERPHKVRRDDDGDENGGARPDDDERDNSAGQGDNADRDGDGIPDHADKCPDQPEDPDGFQDQDGCPDPDNDGDGIPDITDKCPAQPETWNGLADQDGCPDALPPDVQALIGPLAGVAFKAGTVDLAAGATAALDRVAVVLRAPELDHVQFEIAAHTDDQPPPKAARFPDNAALSQARADVVKALLVARGVVDTRLTARGYGATSPLEDPKGLAGPQLLLARKTNARIELRPTSPTPPSP